MPRRYNIRWNQSDDAELKRVVKNFNAKLTRLEKKDPSIAGALPERISAAQLRDMIETRQDLNRELNALRRFSQRGAEELITAPENDYNLKITKWQKEEINRRVGVINRKRSDRLKKMQDIQATSRGEKLGYTKGQIGMGRAEEHSLQPIKGFTAKMNRQDLDKKFRQIMKESQSGYWDKRDEILRGNYIKSLEQNFNPEDIAEIVERIENMDFGEFREIFESEGGNFELSYPPDRDSYDAYLTGLESIWIPNK